jgi:hypothetical protein
VERRSTESESLFSSAQSAEVLGRLGDDITTELHNDATGGLSTDGNVEINFRERPALERAKESVQGQKYSQREVDVILRFNSSASSQ